MAEKSDKSIPMKDDSVEARQISIDTLRGFNDVADEVGGAYEPMAGTEGAVGYTHFDTTRSEDNLVTILLTKENMEELPSQALVRIKSLEDQRDYLGIVVSGPFAEPDGLPADSPIIISTTVQGKIFVPRYHGRAYVQILGEEADGQLIPPRYRPRPNSPVFPLDETETERILKVSEGARIGLVVGQEDIAVRIPTDKKSVLPRHMGILGTTGGGKSTTVSGLVNQLQKANVATILFDVEGEYTEIDSKTEDEKMKVALTRRGLKPEGVQDLHIYYLVGRETSRTTPTKNVQPFCLRFSELSPYAVMEILDLTEPQQDRFYKAYEATQAIMKELKIFPSATEDEAKLLDLDELETGYPKMTISYLIDVASAILHYRVGKKTGDPNLFNNTFKMHLDVVKRHAMQVETKNEISWLALLSRLHRINRLKIFDNSKAKAINYTELIKPGRVSIIDLSDTDSPQINNLVIADILRGVQKEQEARIKASKVGEKPESVTVIIEESHEFLSAQRIKQMPVLFQQVARIAKRGRKRWLGLVFVTQLPQHLPDEVLGLINNFILHKISDVDVINRLRRSISGIDKAQWNLIPGLAPGQALISLTSMTRPLLVSIDATPCKLRLID